MKTQRKDGGRKKKKKKKRVFRMWNVAYNCKIKVYYWSYSFTPCSFCDLIYCQTLIFTGRGFDTDVRLFPPASDVLSWESSGWLTQRQELCQHLCGGGLYQDSISRRFTFDEKNVLLQWSNLQAMRWTPEQTADMTPPVVSPGYYQITILGNVPSCLKTGCAVCFSCYF